MNGLPHNSAPRFPFSTEIPDSYDKAALKIMQCNPFRLYLYWELPEMAADTASRWWLRYSINQADTVPGNADIREIELPPASREWYLDLPQNTVSYCIELVRQASDGAKVAVLQSGQPFPVAPHTMTASPAQQSTPRAISCRVTDALIITPAVEYDDAPSIECLRGSVNQKTTETTRPKSVPSSWSLQGVPPQ